MILEAKDVSISFGGVKALDGCSVGVDKGSVAGLIGPNGAGKTTLLNVIVGFYKHDSGTLRFCEDSIDKLSVHKRVLKGIAMTFQIPRELFKLTVLENLMLAPKNQKGEKIFNALFWRKRVKLQEDESRSKAIETLKFLRIEHLANEYAMNLSTGQKKLLELGRALMLDAQLLLLDEPFSGVHPKLMGEIMSAISQLRSQGKTFMIIEHNMEAIAQVCDIVHFLHNGKCLCSGEAHEIMKDERVIDAYVGRKLVE